MIINGDIGWVKRGDGEAKVYGNALMRNITDGDTLYMKADTMYSIDQKEKGSQNDACISQKHGCLNLSFREYATLWCIIVQILPYICLMTQYFGAKVAK